MFDFLSRCWRTKKPLARFDQNQIEQDLKVKSDEHKATTAQEELAGASAASSTVVALAALSPANLAQPPEQKQIITPPSTSKVLADALEMLEDAKSRYVSSYCKGSTFISIPVGIFSAITIFSIYHLVKTTNAYDNACDAFFAGTSEIGGRYCSDVRADYADYFHESFMMLTKSECENVAEVFYRALSVSEVTCRMLLNNICENTGPFLGYFGVILFLGILLPGVVSVLVGIQAVELYCRWAQGRIDPSFYRQNASQLAPTERAILDDCLSKFGTSTQYKSIVEIENTLQVLLREQLRKEDLVLPFALANRTKTPCAARDHYFRNPHFDRNTLISIFEYTGASKSTLRDGVSQSVAMDVEPAFQLEYKVS